MNQFSIRDIEMLSGIKAHTLRIWEQRHGFTFCKRKESLHRYYDNDDLKQILRISFLYHHGYKISKIAKLSSEEISQITPKEMISGNHEPAVEELVRACINYDEDRFAAALNDMISREGFEVALQKVIYPFLERVGMLWMTDQLIPAQEHFSTSIIQKKIFCLTESLPPVQQQEGKAVVVFAPSGEVHEIPLLVARYVFRKHGVKVYYPGVDVSVKELQYFCTQKQVSHVYFHLITNFQFFDPAEYLQSLQQAIPGAAIIASGPVMNSLKDIPEGVKILSSLEEILRMQKLL